MNALKFILTLSLGSILAVGNSQDLKIDFQKSSLKWIGKKVSGEHVGFIKLKEGQLRLENNKIAAGSFKIDMSTLTNTDIEDPEWNQKLVGHLKSDDFFGVDKFPTSNLIITESSPFKNNKATVKGMLTIKGKTEPITFDVTKNGAEFYALIMVDRTKYDVRYGSGKFFDNLGDKMIYDDFTLDVKLVTN